MKFPFPRGPRNCPARPYAGRLAADPLSRVEVPSGDKVVLAVRHDDVLAILLDPRFSRELFEPGAPRYYPDFDISDAPDAMINMDPPEHTRLRQLTTKSFTARRIEAWRPRVRALANTLIDQLETDEVDFVEAVAFPLPLQVICDVLGVAEIDRDRVRDWSQSLTGSAPNSLDERVVDALEFAGYLIELIQFHREHPTDGLLTALIEAHDAGDRLSDAELVRVVQGLFVGGQESTAIVLARGILRLLAPRDSYARLVDDPGLVTTAVDELLRVEVPSETAFLRVATEDVELPSGLIRKGEGVLPCLVSANHDPAVFDAPDDFRLDRDARAHVAFGRGAHHCLGASLVRMELQEVLGVLVERLPDLALAEDPDRIEWHVGWVRSPTSVRVRLGAR